MTKQYIRFSLAAALSFASVSLADESKIAEGEKIYQSICFSCHGKRLEGATGPNLTDAIWLHGSSDQGDLRRYFKRHLGKGHAGLQRSP